MLDVGSWAQAGVSKHGKQARNEHRASGLSSLPA